MAGEGTVLPTVRKGMKSLERRNVLETKIDGGFALTLAAGTEYGNPSLQPILPLPAGDALLLCGLAGAGVADATFSYYSQFSSFNASITDFTGAPAIGLAIVDMVFDGNTAGYPTDADIEFKSLDTVLGFSGRALKIHFTDALTDTATAAPSIVTILPNSPTACWGFEDILYEMAQSGISFDPRSQQLVMALVNTSATNPMTFSRLVVNAVPTTKKMKPIRQSDKPASFNQKAVNGIYY